MTSLKKLTTFGFTASATVDPKGQPRKSGYFYYLPNTL